MKKGLFLGLALMMIGGTAMAADMMGGKMMAPIEMAGISDTSWVLQVQGGAGFLATTPSNYVTIGGVGYNLEGSLGYAFSKDFSLSLLTGYDAYPGRATFGANEIHMSYTPLLAVGQLDLGGKDFDPYVTLGAGIALNDFTLSDTVSGISDSEHITETDFLLSPGFGVSFPLAPKSRLFLQARVDIDFYSDKYAEDFTVPSFKPFDKPEIFIPVQLGVNFDVK